MRKPLPVIASLLAMAIVATVASANPYPDPNRVPVDPIRALPRTPKTVLSVEALRAQGVDVLRVDVAWTESGETFAVTGAVKERSGTAALVRRTAHADPHGSYRGELLNRSTGVVLSRATVGTGSEFRLLTRAMAFRFPVPAVPVDFRLVVENPKTGALEEALHEAITPTVSSAAVATDLEVRLLKAADQEPALLVNVYAEGYATDQKEKFFQEAAKVTRSLADSNFPGNQRFELHAVWSPSGTTLGRAKDLGLPVAERDSFLGLYFPYWRNFGRWYHVVYPTRETRFRNALAQVPYDYPIALVDDGSYWGVGNFMELTAIPARNSSFTYLLTHEFGHFFGLNEEYEGGGPTELAFAAEIEEPWSQNITFNTDGQTLKWKRFVAAGTAIPTKQSAWSVGAWGAYKGGYADSEPRHMSHKPGFNCTMEAGRKFCAICQDAIEARVKFDLGE